MSDYEWGVLHGAERVLAAIVTDINGKIWNSAIMWRAIQKHVGGMRLMREILTELQEVRSASDPSWPRILRPVSARASVPPP